MKLKDNSTQEIDTALYQLEQKLKSNIRLTDVENSNASTAKINAVDKKLTEEIKDRQSADEKLQDNINKEIADRQDADAAIENAKQDKLIAGDNIQIDGNVISATSKEYTAEAPVKVTDGKISLDTVPVTKGGTGVTTQADINKAFVSGLGDGTDDVTDGTMFVSSCASDNGFADTTNTNVPYKRKFIKVWNYIKGKISSVLGLTKDNYGGKASTAGTADKVANALTVNGKTYDGSSVVNAGVQTVANGGTGATTAKEAEYNIVVPTQNDTIDAEAITDESRWTGTYISPSKTTGRLYTKKFNVVWNYIKDKISSILGLTKDNYGGKASTAGTADKTVNDITISIPFVQESGEYVIPLGNIPEPTSTAVNSPYNWDITGFFSIIRSTGHNGAHLWFEAGHGYSHDWTTYAYLDKLEFRAVTTSIKAFQYEGKWWLGLCIITSNQGYSGKMTITYSRGLPATPTCILYNSRSGGIANEEIYNSIQDIPSSWWKTRTIDNPTAFTSNIAAQTIKANTNFIGNLTGNVTGNATTADSATNDGNGNNIVNTYAKKTDLTSWNISNAAYTGNPNDCAIGKWYSIDTSSNSTNMPNVNGWATIITFAVNNNASYKQQLCFYTNNNTIYTRTCLNDAWGDWVSLSKTGHTHDYLPLSGGAMTGNIQYKGTKSVTNAIKFIDNTADTSGNGISIGAGGLTIIGGGESSDVVAAQQSSGGDEKLIVANDGAIDFYTNCQNGFASAKHITMNSNGTITADGFNGTATKSKFLDEYPGAGSTRLTSGNIKPKDASEYGGMRKDVVTSSMTDSGRPNKDGHLLTMFWDNTGRFDSQFFVSNEKQPVLKARGKGNETDYGPWIDVITSNNIGSQTVANATNARTAADAGYLCKLYQLDSATSDTTIQANNVILLGKIPDPASTEAPATPSESWDIDVDFYFVRAQGHKAAWCNVKAGYGYSNAWRKYGLIETFGVDFNLNYSKPFYLVTVKYNNGYYIGVRHKCDIDGAYSARVNNVNTNGNRNPSTVNTALVNMLKVIPYQKTNGTVLNSEIKTSIADFPNTYAPAVERNGDLVLKSGYVKIGASGVAGSKLTIHGATVNSNSYTDTNPKLEFKNNDGSQNISLTFTDFDAVQAPASLTLNGNQGNEYFIAPNIKATTNFIGNLTGNVTGNVSGSSGSASKLTTARTAYVELGNANTNTTIDWSGTTTIPVNGVLGVANGGTGATTAEAAANSLIASLPSSQNVPVDSDYFISQVVNGGPFVPGYERRPISKLWEYIKGKILQEGEDFGYNHIVYDNASLLEWANCTDGHMKKVLVKSGTYNMTKGVDFSKAGTGYVFAENGAVINSKVPIAFSAPSGKTTIHNLHVVCGPSSDNTCAFSANNIENLILYDCEAGYATNTITVDRNLFSKCTCYNCHYNFTYSSSNSSMSIKVFYQCYCYNCICKQTIAANSSSAVSFADRSYFYMECVCISCDAELTILRNIKAANPTFACYYNCWDRCVGCLSTINVNSKSLTVYSTLYGFLRCQHMSSCKEVHTVGYSNIKGVVQCIYISSTSAVSGESNTSVGNSCDI